MIPNRLTPITHSQVDTGVSQDEGHIVNTASVAGLLAAPWMAPYNASKHAVVGVSESLFHELAAVGSRVGVSVLCPGFVRTHISDASRNWPVALGPVPDDQEMPGSAEVREAIRAAIESGTDPAVVAAAVRDAIVNGTFWILTHAEFSDAITARFGGAVEGRNPEPAGLL